MYHLLAKNTNHHYIFISSMALGGAEKIVSDFLWQVSHTHEYEKYTLIIHHTHLIEHSIPPGVNVIRLNSNIHYAKALFLQLKHENKPLIAHLMGDICTKYAYDLGVKVIHVVHNVKKSWKVSVENLNHPNCQAIVAVSQKIKTELLDSAVKTPIIVFRHVPKIAGLGKIDELLKTSPTQIASKLITGEYIDNTRLEILKKYSIDEQDVTILMTGRVVEQKNYALAVKVLEKLNTKLEFELKDYRAHLFICGGVEKKHSPYYLSLVQLAASCAQIKNIHFMGHQPLITSMMAGFDLGLNTSHWEGLSIATQEMMHCGLDVVASRVGGQEEILDPHHQLTFFDLENKDIDLSKDYPPKSSNAVQTQDHTIDLKSTTTSDAVCDSLCDLLYASIEKIKSTQAMQHLNKVDKILSHKASQTCAWSSQSAWGLLHALKSASNNINNNTYVTPPKTPKTLFITNDLGLGGAQKSLINLLCTSFSLGLDSASRDFCSTTSLLVLKTLGLDKTNLLNRLQEKNINVYLSQENSVFLNAALILDKVQNSGYRTLVYWSVDSAIKVIIAKLKPYLEQKYSLKIVEVSPGDYISQELQLSAELAKGIYYDTSDYPSSVDLYISKFTPTTKDTVDSIDHMGARQLVIPNGVQTDFGSQQWVDKKQENFELYSLSTGSEFKFLVCGRIAKSKMIDKIANSYSELLKHTTLPCTLTFVGSTSTESASQWLGEIKSQHASLIEENKIQFKPQVTNPIDILAEYDCLIVLGVNQGSPNMVLEAASYGIPIITNDSGGTREVINNSTGILLDTNPSVEKVSHAMRQVLEDYSSALMRALAAQAHVRENFSLSKMAYSYISALGELNATASILNQKTALE